MAAKPAPTFHNSQFDPPLMYHPLYMTSAQDHLDEAPAAAPRHGAAAAAAAPENVSLFSRADGAGPVHDEGGGSSGISFAERFKRWSFEQERHSAIANASDLQGFNMSTLLTVNNDPASLFANAADADEVNRGGSAAADAINAGRHYNLLASLGSSCAAGGESMQQSFLPISNSNTPYPEAAYASTGKPQYSTTAHADMEILKVNQAHNTATSASVHLFEDIPSPALTHQSVGFSAASTINTFKSLYASTTPTHTFDQAHHHPSPLLHDPAPFPSPAAAHHHLHQWGPSLRTSSVGSHPHAELLLLPGVAESTVVEASPSSHMINTHNAGLSASNKLDLLHGSSLHDKRGPNVLPLQGIAAGGGERVSAPSQMWHIDKLEMSMGLGLQNNSARPSVPMSGFHHYASTHGGTQSGLSLFLQSSPQQRTQTAFSLDAARYSARSAPGSLGVLRNSKYLKAAQHLLNEFCSVCRDGSSNRDAKRSTTIQSAGYSVGPCNFWTATGEGGTRFAASEENMNDMGAPDAHDSGQLLTSRGFFSAATDKSSLYQLKSASGTAGASSGGRDMNQQNKTTSDEASTAPAKQLPADERCHLQMRKARLVAMVEELDRRYQQYRDHMQLIVTSFESATGLGGAAPYTTLARRAMSRQFRGLRDAIGEHISTVCNLLGEEVSSVPILSRGETPRLRLVDQRLRHQRSLQQIGMLPQQQAWRPQRGLPERSVSVLRAWLFEHFLHPYPKDSEKAMLARLTGLSRNQVSNWFINARVRLWKPMIEEMYLEESKALEMQQQTIRDGLVQAVDAHGTCNAGGGSVMLQLEEEAATDEHCQYEQAGAVPPSATASARMEVMGWVQQAAAAAHSYNGMNTGEQYCAAAPAMNDLNSFIHSLHSSSANNFNMKSGVSLTLGLQQPPPPAPPPPHHHPHAALYYHIPSAAAAYNQERPSEALLF